MLDALTLQRSAERLIRKYGTRDALRIARAEGVAVYEKPLGQLLGFYTCFQKHRVIVLNESLDDDRRAIVLAHELGHDMLHRSRAREGALQEYVLFEMKDPSEYEANAFAAHLLIDTDELLEYIRLYQNDYSAVSRHFHCYYNLTLIKIAELSRLGLPGLQLPDRPRAGFLSSIPAGGSEG